MFGLSRPAKPRRDEAEKPFWISFSDLMSGLMVLFLVAMTVALLAITRQVTEGEQDKARRDKDIHALLQRVQREVVRDFPGVTVHGQTIDFGDQARFDTDSHRLSPDEARVLRRFVPRVLALARDPLGEKWLKRVVVEGFADTRGSYLHNLNLSLQRSERVLCVLLADGSSVPDPLSAPDRQMVRDIFLVGGSSYNEQRSSPEASRRIELKLEFLDVGEKRPSGPVMPLDGDTRCPMD